MRSDLDRVLKQRDDAYAVLGLDKKASKDEIKRSYRRLALLLHPDKNPAAEAVEVFQVVVKAYETLLDDERRSLYDVGGYSAVHRQEQQGDFPPIRVVLAALVLWYTTSMGVPMCARKRNSASQERFDMHAMWDCMGHFARRRQWLATLAAVLVVTCLLSLGSAVEMSTPVCSLERTQSFIVPGSVVAGNATVVVYFSVDSSSMTRHVCGKELVQDLLKRCHDERSAAAASRERFDETAQVEHLPPLPETFSKVSTRRRRRCKFEPNVFSVPSAEHLLRISSTCSRLI